MKGGEGGMFCDEPDCIREAQKGGKCWAHRKRIQRHGTPADTGDVLVDVALRLADCNTNDDAEFERRKAALFTAARRLKHSGG